MNTPLEDYIFLSKINNIKDIAYQKLYKNYIDLKLSGPDKLIEINSTDQESLIKSLNNGLPVPGMIYTFIYPPNKDDHVKVIEQGKEKEYVDFIPLIFCVTTRPDSFDGINLNTLPNLERLKFLNQFYEVYKDFFKDVERKTENDILAINIKYIQLAMSGKGSQMIKDFSTIQRANFAYGYRRYLKQRVKNFRLIEFSEWQYIAHFNPKDAFKLLNLAQIHALYWKTKNNI
jgi:hypothetical protein